MFKRISRKRFFRLITNLLLLVFAIAVAKLSRLHEVLTETRTFTVNYNSLNEGYNFFDEFIVVKQNSEVHVVSSKCTHLGCRINKAEADELVCPCHGSRYNSNGHPVKGPAPKSLAVPDYEIVGEKIIVTFTM